jgi:hypothetical protein
MFGLVILTQETLLAWFTGALVAVGLIQALILFFTIRAINRQTATAQNSDRAWIMAEIEWDREKWADGKEHILEGSGTGGESTGIYVVLVCRNEGKSPCWIYEKRAKFEIVRSLNPEPNFDSAQFIWEGREPIGTGNAFPHTTKLSWLAIAQGHAKSDDMVVLYGIVRYRDIFNEPRTTTVGYRITEDRRLERLTEYAGYNENT